MQDRHAIFRTSESSDKRALKEAMDGRCKPFAGPVAGKIKQIFSEEVKDRKGPLSKHVAACEAIEKVFSTLGPGGMPSESNGAEVYLTPIPAEALQLLSEVSRGIEYLIRLKQWDIKEPDIKSLGMKAFNDQIILSSLLPEFASTDPVLRTVVQSLGNQASFESTWNNKIKPNLPMKTVTDADQGHFSAAYQAAGNAIQKFLERCAADPPKLEKVEDAKSADG